MKAAMQMTRSEIQDLIETHARAQATIRLQQTTIERAVRRLESGAPDAVAQALKILKNSTSYISAQD